jgi:hypothetical protein
LVICRRNGAAGREPAGLLYQAGSRSFQKPGFLNTVEDPSFFENDRTDCRLIQTQHTRLVVAAAEVSGVGHRHYRAVITRYSFTVFFRQENLCDLANFLKI